MLKTQPTTAALLINHNVSTQPADLAAAFRSLETTHHLHIRLTHTGVIVRSRGAGKVVFEEGDWRRTRSGRAEGAAECARMRMFGINMLTWAAEHYPTAIVHSVLKALTDD